MISNEILEEFKKNGIVRIPNFLTGTDLSEITNLIKYYSAKKGENKSYFISGFKSLFSNLLKFNLKKIKDSLFLHNFAKRKEIHSLSKKIFNKNSYLNYIDGYVSPISDKDLIPWHTDQAYQGIEKVSKEYVNPDEYFLKFFIYLSDVDSQNGCMNYIPGSHQIGYAIRKGIYEGSIEYKPYWHLKDFRKILLYSKNINYFKNYFSNNNIIDKFIEDTRFITENKDTVKYDYTASAGDMILFDEGGVHRGSKTLKNERMVLRFLYSIKKKYL
jgi:hypothetical protein